MIEQDHRFIKTNLEYAWIQIMVHIYKNECWNRGHVYGQKRTNPPRREVCPKADISYQ